MHHVCVLPIPLSPLYNMLAGLQTGHGRPLQESSHHSAATHSSILDRSMVPSVPSPSSIPVILSSRGSLRSFQMKTVYQATQYVETRPQTRQREGNRLVQVIQVSADIRHRVGHPQRRQCHRPPQMHPRFPVVVPTQQEIRALSRAKRKRVPLKRRIIALHDQLIE